MYGNPEDVLFALEAYKKAKELTGEKTLLLISGLGCWGANDYKVKKDPVKEEELLPEGQDPNTAAADTPILAETQAVKENTPEKKKMGGFDDDDEDEPKKETSKVEEPVAELKKPEAPIEEEVEDEKPPVFLPWTDKDYVERIPIENFQRIKEIEDQVLSFTMEGVKTFVICPGLLYGSGEDALEHFFRAAWLQMPQKLPIPGDGQNYLPAIHVNDLATFALKIADSPPEQKYHFAFDGNKDRTLGSLIQSISAAVGSGQIECVESTPLVKPEHSYLFSLNFWALSSELLATPIVAPPADEISKPTDEGGEPALVPEEPPVVEDPEFDWHSKRGINEKGKQILSEFSKTHNLRQLNIYLQGDPESRKEEFAQNLCKHYNIPIVRLEEVFGYIEAMCTDQELLADLKEEWPNINTVIHNGTYNLGLNETGKVIYRCLKYRLSQNDCANRGYIFDDPILGEKDLDLLFGILSKKKLKRIRPKPKKQKKSKKPKKDDQVAADGVEAETTQKEDNEKPVEDDEGEEEVAGDEVAEGADGEGEPTGQADAADDDNKEGEEEEKEEEDKEEEEPVEEENEEEGPKLEKFLPESFIFFEADKRDFRFSTDTENPRKEELLNFCDKMKIETLSINLTASTEYEGLEDLRLYIERVKTILI